MTYSMTGFGRGEAQDDLRKFTVEIKTVNHRYNDIYLKMSSSLNVFEDKIKKIIKEKIQRGRIEVYIKLEGQKSDEFIVKPNFEVIDQYYKAYNEIKEKYDKTEEISFELLLNNKNALEIEYVEADENEIWVILKNAISDALEKVLEMRKAEGIKLKEDILEKKESIECTLKTIEGSTKEIVSAYQEKMRERIQEIIEDSVELDEDRIVQETAIFADKTDINEEIVRLKSHLNQLEEIFNSGGASGRKLDFLAQEMNREVNTIGSKTGDFDVSSAVIDMKSDIEKIREQIRNVE